MWSSFSGRPGGSGRRARPPPLPLIVPRTPPTQLPRGTYTRLIHFSSDKSNFSLNCFFLGRFVLGRRRVLCVPRTDGRTQHPASV